MKTSSFPLIAFVAALAAIALFPIGAAAAGLAVSVTGIASVLVADYGRNREPLRAPPRVIPANASGDSSREWREAA